MMCIGNCEASGTLIYTYNNGEVTSQLFSRLYGVGYAERTGYIYNSNMHAGYMFDEFFKLDSGVFTIRHNGGKDIAKKKVGFHKGSYCANLPAFLLHGA